jgi:hypothetical protein
MFYFRNTDLNILEGFVLVSRFTLLMFGWKFRVTVIWNGFLTAKGFFTDKIFMKIVHGQKYNLLFFLSIYGKSRNLVHFDMNFYGYVFF